MEIDTETETWIPLQFNSAYEVSNLGRVRSWLNTTSNIRRKEPAFIQPVISANGYPRVQLYSAGRKKKYTLHLLVLRAFKGDQEFPGSEASHLNGNRKDARLINLEWESRAQNNARKKDHGTILRGAQVHASRLRVDQVIAIRNLHAEGLSFHKIAQAFNVKTFTVSQICKRKHYKHVL